jgi:hypothetical protein
MDLTTSLQITPKGEDEVKRRVYKLNMKKRSLLILLDKTQTVDYLLHRTVLHQDEFMLEIKALIHEGFVALGGEIPHHPVVTESIDRTVAAPVTAPVIPQVYDEDIYLEDEIILSEAKFLLTDFAVDSFGTQSQAIVEDIHTCRNVNDLRVCLNTIFTTTEKQCPDRLPTLLNLVKEINETA